MMNSLFRGIVLMLFLLPAWSYADSISCTGGIVSTGDSTVDLITKCGKPEWKESYQEEITDQVNPNLKERTYSTLEKWTYNFGPQQFLRTVTLRNGMISEISTGTYGTSKGGVIPGPACDDRIISVGDTKTDILIKCGKPFYKSSHQEEVKERFDDASSRKLTVPVEEWTYNFGPQQFLRIITFRNGIVVDIRMGGYGTK